jgi:transcriptional regulator with XRE-family HTH domain
MSKRRRVVKEPEATEDARRALGAELAAYRTAAGYNQARLAELTSYSRSTIANVETGRQKVPRAFWERADTALRTGGVLASAHDDIEASLRQHRQAAAREVSAARQVRLRQADDPAHALAFEYESNGGQPEHPEVADLQLTNLIPPAEAKQQEDGDIAKADSDGSVRRVNPGDVIRLRGMCEQLKNIDNTHGGGAALPMTMGYLRHETPLLNGLRPADPTDRALIDVFALFWLGAGWMAYDAAEQQLATENFTQALRLAHAAGDRLLGGRVLAAMSHQAVYLGQVRQAIDYAQAARTATRIVSTPRTVAMLAAMEACAHAAAGDAPACRKALDEAAQAVTEIRAQPEPEGLDFDEGGYWGHAARAYRDLGRLAEAEQYAQRSVGLCLPAHGRTRAQRYAIHAAAHLRMGEVDAAAAAGEHIVREAWTLHSSHVFGEIAQLAKQLAQHKSPVAADFLDQARELLEARGPKAASAST